jgi:hypothetical protein
MLTLILAATVQPAHRIVGAQHRRVLAFRPVLYAVTGFMGFDLFPG